MADTKISGMTAATALTGAEVLPVVQSAANVKATTQQVVDAAMTTGLTRQALGSINTNTTIDWSVGSYVTATIGGALTFTFSNPAPTGKACVAYLQLTNGGSAVITWPVSVTWSGGTAPTLRASGVDLLRFYTQDNGTTWFGTAEIDEQQFAASAITSGTIDTARLGSGTANSTTFLRGDQTWAAVSASPGGSDTQVQFNDGGSAAGDSGLTYNKTTDTLTVAGPVIRSGSGTRILVGTGTGASDICLWTTTTGLIALNGNNTAVQTFRATTITADSSFVIGSGGLQYSGTFGWGSLNSGLTDFVRHTASELCVTGATTTYDTILTRDAANTLALRNSTNAQTFRVYKTYTDASNHARLTVSAGVLDSPSLQIIGESAGTGTYTNVDIGYSNTKLLRQNGTSAILFGQHFVSFSDNTYDIGSSSAGWRTGYFDTSVITPTIANAGTSILAATRLRADGFATALTSKTADYTATATDTTILVDASGAARTITLPAASGISGRIYVIKKTDSSGNAVTVDADASETIDGATTYTLSAQYKFVVVQCDGANWHIIGAN